MAAKNKKRTCSAKTKAGKPCRGPVMKGQKTCLAHAPAKLRESKGFRPDNGKAGRPKNPRVVDVLRERIEERVDEVISVYLEAMKADRTIVIGKGEDAVIEKEVDHAIRLRAVEALNDRAYGKPGQAFELTGKGGGPIEFNEDAFADPKTRKGLDELARRLGATR